MWMTVIQGAPVICLVAKDGKDDGGGVDIWENCRQLKPEGDVLFRSKVPRMKVVLSRIDTST